MLKEREFIKTSEEVYKIGRTKRRPEERAKEYPKGSKLIWEKEVINCVEVERRIKDKFDNEFKNRRDIGREYYEGDEREMREELKRICHTNNMEIMEKINRIEEGRVDEMTEIKEREKNKEIPIYIKIIENEMDKMMKKRMTSKMLYTMSKEYAEREKMTVRYTERKCAMDLRKVFWRYYVKNKSERYYYFEESDKDEINEIIRKYKEG